MQYLNLGRSGLMVSRVCLGAMGFGTPAWRAWVLDEAQSRPLLQRAVELGINFFDTADMYSAGESERVLGRALKELTRRDDAVIATKAYFPTGEGPNERGLSRKHLISACEASLQRLGTDYIDLYYIHRWNYSTPVEETLAALDHLVQSGKVRYLGASSMAAWQFAKALYLQDRRGWARFIAMQDHYNLLYREEEREMHPLCREEGVGIVPWSPLARGALAGKRDRLGGGESVRAKTDKVAQSLYYREDWVRDADGRVLDALLALAQERGVEPAQIALAWILRKSTAPVIGPTKVAQLESAVAALDVQLSDKEVKRLEAQYVPHPVVGHGPYDTFHRG